MAEHWDVAIIGAGIAGASLAFELAGRLRVVLVEREFQPGYHTTGRSAALFSETYGPPAIRALSRASAAFFGQPPEGFASARLLTPRGVMLIAREDQQRALNALHREVADRGNTRLIEAPEIEHMVPLIRPGYAVGALYEENARDIDVHALHHGFLRGFKAAGGVVRTGCDIRMLERDGGSWLVSTAGGAFRADIVVNAAGAWADEIASRAGVPAIGLIPKRRTALIVTAPEGVEPNGWPMVVDIDEKFYLKPDAGRLLISPADETPSPPCDAQPEEIDIALCVDRIQHAFDLETRHIENEWAGLRSFVADKTPVAGYDPDVPGFFWLAGQGGYGIQSAPALARMAAALLERRPVPADIAGQGVDETALMPRRPELAA